MAKKPIVNHGTIINTTNYKALIEAQAKTRTYLDIPPVEEPIFKPKVLTKNNKLYRKQEK